MNDSSTRTGATLNISNRETTIRHKNEPSHGMQTMRFCFFFVFLAVGHDSFGFPPWQFEQGRRPTWNHQYSNARDATRLLPRKYKYTLMYSCDKAGTPASGSVRWEMSSKLVSRVTRSSLEAVRARRCVVRAQSLVAAVVGARRGLSVALVLLLFLFSVNIFHLKWQKKTKKTTKTSMSNIMVLSFITDWLLAKMKRASMNS